MTILAIFFFVLAVVCGVVALVGFLEADPEMFIIRLTVGIVFGILSFLFWPETPVEEPEVAAVAEVVSSEEPEQVAEAEEGSGEHTATFPSLITYIEDSPLWTDCHVSAFVAQDHPERHCGAYEDGVKTPEELVARFTEDSAPRRIPESFALSMEDASQMDACYTATAAANDMCYLVFCMRVVEMSTADETAYWQFGDGYWACEATDSPSPSAVQPELRTSIFETIR